jgi:hypothetical protein
VFEGSEGFVISLDRIVFRMGFRLTHLGKLSQTGQAGDLKVCSWDSLRASLMIKFIEYSPIAFSLHVVPDNIVQVGE